MKVVDVAYRTIYSLVFAAVCLAALSFLVGEAVVYWYMHHHEIAERIDLSEDYGFGLIVLLVECVALLVALPFALILGWRISGSWR